ncbi:MAG: hydantoinase/oxoprolinase family protein [Candidatus Thermoplasmatota archaeon]|nr:hydantoinase/oxoprolinase family protein [Candidatus Thermoplasmatota archaeon]
MNLKIGVDVGSTYTDGVVIDDSGRILHNAKEMTTFDITTGIVGVLGSLATKLGSDKDSLSAVMIGTTHGINALSQVKSLNRIAVVRISLPSGSGIPPFAEWPPSLREYLSSHVIMVHGGHEYTGDEISELDENALKSFFRSIKGKVDAVSITSVFSFVNPDHELRAGAIARDILGDDIFITLSHNISSLGLLERENSTIINSAIEKVMRNVISATRKTLGKLFPERVKLFFSQNDGTVAEENFATKFPVFTVAGPISNSVRGAFVLTGIEDAVVLDIGGTTTNCGVLTKGYPRESSNPVEISGVKTNFRMPDIIAIPLGGGTTINGFNVGPLSVGYELPQKGLSFGGDILTTTDVSLALKEHNFENTDYRKVLSRNNGEYLDKVYEIMSGKWFEVFDRMKSSNTDVPLIAVGGGSFMIPPGFPGASGIIVPDGAEYANAIGAATSQVGSVIEKAFSYDTVQRNRAIEETISAAKDNAELAGADRSTLEVKDIEEVSMPYLPGNSVKVSVRVIGKMRL